MVAIVILGYLLVACAGYWGGYNHSRLHMDMSETKIDQLGKRKQQLEVIASENKAMVVKQTQELLLERQTIELLRQENIELQGKIEYLEKELTLFQRIVKSNSDAKGLVLGRLELEDAGDSTFELSLDVIQISGRGRVKGKLYLEVEGFDSEQKSQKRSLPLHQISGAHTEKAVALSFTNYQSVNVTVKLPYGFTPSQILVKAQFTRGKKVTLEERYDWTLKG